MKVDVAARVIGIVALAIALADIGVTWLLWTRSGPRLKVGLRRLQHPSDRLEDRLVIEASNIGRMPVLVQELGIEDRISAGPGGQTTSYIGISLAPSEGELPRVISHTDLPVKAEVGMPQIIERWAPDRTLTLVAWAKDGNGRKRISREIKLTTPRWPV